MARLTDFTGQQFGGLTVIQYQGYNNQSGAKWLCKCACGNEVELNGRVLSNGKVKDCGCLKPIKSHKFIELTGQRFGRLVVLRREGKGPIGTGILWRCMCDCGNETIVSGGNLRSKHTQSCGCYHSEVIVKHGQYLTSEYTAWYHMKQRCYNPKCKHFNHYGGRGITVCERWLENFSNFFADMGNKPTPAHSIDRINNELGYSPDNCRWADKKTQASNRRTTKKNHQQ